MTTDPTTHHVMIADDGSLMALFRLRTGASVFFRTPTGPARAGWRNGQDYDLIDEAEAERLAAQMERGEA